MSSRRRPACRVCGGRWRHRDATPADAWRGGDARAPLGGHVPEAGCVREHRDLLLPGLHALQARLGSSAAGALGYVCRRLDVPPAEGYGVARFYGLLSLSRARRRSRTSATTSPARWPARNSCVPSPARAAAHRPRRADVAADRRARWPRSPCLGLCEQAPAAVLVAVAEPGEAVARADAFGAAGSRGPGRSGAIRVTRPGAERQAATLLVGEARPTAHLLARAGAVDPADLTDYRAGGGFRALAAPWSIGAAAVSSRGDGSRAGRSGRRGVPHRAASGRPWRPPRRIPTTSCATPTSPSRARSRTGC